MIKEAKSKLLLRLHSPKQSNRNVIQNPLRFTLGACLIANNDLFLLYPIDINPEYYIFQVKKLLPIFALNNIAVWTTDLNYG